jgi:hypothetical protein
MATAYGWAQLRAVWDEQKGYLVLQSNRPQTIAYGLTDSPVAQLAWILGSVKEWTNPAAGLPEDAVDVRIRALLVACLIAAASILIATPAEAAPGTSISTRCISTRQALIAAVTPALTPNMS